MQLTKEQRIFIEVEYGAMKNCGQVIRAFKETLPEMNSLDMKSVYRSVRKFNEHGNILNRNKGNSGRKITQRTEDNIAIVQRVITKNLAISVRLNETNLSKSTFHRILKKDICLYPYKMQIKYELQPCDYARRRAFCNWFISKDQRFTKRLVVTEEAAFSIDGRVNTQSIGSGLLSIFYGRKSEYSKY